MRYDFDLRVEVAGGGAVRAVVSGEMDMAVAGVVAGLVAGLLRTDGVGSVRVDLSGLRFLDASGISALLAARQEADARGKTFRVVEASGAPLQVLEIAGVLDVLAGKVTGADR